MIIPGFKELPMKDKRRAFLDWLLRVTEYDVSISKTKNAQGYRNEKVDYAPRFRVCALNPQVEPEWETYDSYNFKQAWDTRTVLPTELIIEFDFPEFQKNICAFYTVFEELLKQKLHFTVFYAEGQKCPHIRIYDFLPSDLDEELQYHTRLAFCRKIVPFEYFHKLDKGLLMTGKTTQLEFAKHWRTGKMFRLLGEWGADDGTSA
jgi:hypothetical protein